MSAPDKSSSPPLKPPLPRFWGVILGLMMGLPVLIWLPLQSDFYRDAEWLLAKVVAVGAVQTREQRSMQFVTLALGLDQGGVKRSSLWLATGQVSVGDSVRVWYNPTVPPYTQIVAYKPFLYWALILLGWILLMRWLATAWYRFRLNPRRKQI